MGKKPRELNLICSPDAGVQLASTPQASLLEAWAWVPQGAKKHNPKGHTSLLGGPIHIASQINPRESPPSRLWGLLQDPWLAENNWNNFKEDS